MSTAAKSVQQQLEELSDMPVARLRARYAEVYGEGTTSANRQWLYRRVAWRIQALAEGDLSERARRRAEELARDADVRVRPPAGGVADWCGGEVGGQAASRPRPRLVSLTGRVRVNHEETRLPMPGTVLEREYKRCAARGAGAADGL